MSVSVVLLSSHSYNHNTTRASVLGAAVFERMADGM